MAENAELRRPPSPLATVPYSKEGLLRSLPDPGAGLTGWPWTEERTPATDLMEEGRSWPKISIVTPSFNQCRYIEETIRSVLLQNYPNLEYIVMDGGSTDGTREILERYSPWLSYWVSERDAGQSDAIARGFELAGGDIIAWLCSDDLYLPGALSWAAQAHAGHPEAGLICGETNLDQGTGWVEWSEFRYKSATPTFLKLLACGQTVRQPGCFWTMKAYRATAGMDRTLDFCMDYDLFIKLCKVTSARYFDHEVAWMRRHDEAKSARLNHVWQAESLSIVERELQARPAPTWYLCALSYVHAIRYVMKTPLFDGRGKILRIGRLVGGYIYHLLKGDVFRWHPVGGYGGPAGNRK